MRKKAKNKLVNRIKNLYPELRKKHGASDKQWRLWCKRPKTLRQREEIIIGAILTQNTSWRNVAKAMANLEKRGWKNLKAIWLTSRRQRQELENILRPAGFFRQKTAYLANLADFIFKKYQGVEKMLKAPLKDLRGELLSLKGVGPETADSILLYALDKPVFVIDEYTRRLLEKKGIAKNKKYSVLQELFHSSFKKDYRLFQDFHALIVINAKAKGK